MQKLKMTLLFRGRPLSYLRQNEDFSRKVLIGADPALFWQVLADNFPRRHTLLHREGDMYRLHCRNEWNMTVNGAAAQGVVTLTPGLSGAIALNADWKVDFSWEDVRSSTPTQAELALRREYARRPPLSAEQRFTRLFMALAILLSAIGAGVINELWEPTTYVQHIMEYAPAPLSETARRAAIEPADWSPEPEGDEAVSAEEIRTQPGAPSLADIFGDGSIPFVGNGDASRTPTADDLVSIDVSSVIAVAGDGSRALAANDAMARFERMASQDGLPSDYTGGSLIADDISVGEGTASFSAADVAAMRMQGREFTVTPLMKRGALNPAAAAMIRPDAPPLTEEAIEANPQQYAGRGDIAPLRATVNAYQRQIETLFMRESQLVDMHGVLIVTLYIDDSGVVLDARLLGGGESVFTESFIDKTYNLLLDWRLPVSQNTVYEFKMTFMQ